MNKLKAEIIHTLKTTVQKAYWLSCIKTLAYLFLPILTPLTVHAAGFDIPSGNVDALIEAIEAANANGEDDTIFLEAGIYTLTEMNNSTDGANGLPSVTSTLEIIGVGPDVTIIERDITAEPFRIFHVVDTGTLILQGVSVIGGFVECCDIGGGIFNNGSLTITNCEIFGNSAEFEGGGIASNGAITVNSSIISNNTAQDGGGIFGGSVDITNSTISDNFAQGFGGGIDGTVNMTDSEILNNSAGFLGGGIFGTITMKNSIVADNSSDFRGGGIANIGTSHITNTTISDNSGNFSAGAIANSGILTITNSSISGNSTSFGSVVDNSESIFILLNSTIANNNGGGIENVDGMITIINSTISNNEFGIENFNGSEFFGIVELQNTIIALNNLGDCFGPITSLGNNLIGSSISCDLSTGPNDLSGDPGLGDFTDDGTPGNGHYPLLASSQAINAGNHETCLNTPMLAADQIGQQRIGTCDIGAIESPKSISLINELVKIESVPNTFMPVQNIKACSNTYSRKFRFRDKLTNLSDSLLSNIAVILKEVTSKNSLKNFGQETIIITVLNRAGYKDGLLKPGESAQVRFELCFAPQLKGVISDLVKAAIGRSDLADLVDIKGLVTRPDKDLP